MDENTLSPTLRCRFSKTGPIRYISHLDLTRAFLRALVRAEIDLKYSEGFNPHPKFSFALPLSVGTESRAEICDFALAPNALLPPEEVKRRLEKEMPAGITIQSVAVAEEKFSAIAFCAYEIFLPLADSAPEEVTCAIQAPLLCTKKTKKGKTVELDIADRVERFSCHRKDGGLFLDVLLCADGEKYLKPELLLDALQQKMPALDLTRKHILRTGTFRTDKSAF